ncbi:MAG: hypothetical protein ACYDH8_06295 [Syntrophales bacterium]
MTAHGNTISDSASQNHRKYWSANHLTVRPWRPRVTTIRKHLVLTIAIVVFLVSCSNSEVPAAQRGSGLPGNVVVASKYYEDNLSKCGDSYIAEWTFSDRSGSRLVELKGVKYNTAAIPLSQADRLNGLEDAFESWIQPTAVRQTRSPRNDWETWRDEKTVFRFRFIKVKGNWNVTPVSAGFSGISGYLAKYPCDNVPGHPARLARERQEQEQAQRVAEARAAEQEAKNRVERQRVVTAIAGEWVSGGYRLTITPEGENFSAVALGLYSNIRRIMNGALLSNGVLKLTTVNWELIDKKYGGQGVKNDYFQLTLAPDGRSLTGTYYSDGIGGTLAPFSRP